MASLFSTEADTPTIKEFSISSPSQPLLAVNRRIPAGNRSDSPLRSAAERVSPPAEPSKTSPYKPCDLAELRTESIRARVEDRTRGFRRSAIAAARARKEEGRVNLKLGSISFHPQILTICQNTRHSFKII